MASELRQIGVDFSFAPVLDLGRGVCDVIGDRAFHSDPEVVADLAHAYMLGMQRAGMAAVGKHFPGHGSVRGDSHLELPVDDRDFEDISNLDLIPFERLVHYGIAGMMPAHVLYPRVDRYPAGFSHFWLQTVLRQRLGFEGLIFSDDLSMEGAVGMGGIAQRARLALDAGCDMVLVCNDPEASDRLLSGLKHEPDPAALARYAHMHGRSAVQVASRDDAAWHEAVEAVSHYA
jgi:beta-N-acetylhexosaminidase